MFWTIWDQIQVFPTSNYRKSLPVTDSHEVLCGQFSDFFIEKFAQIRETITHTNTNVPAPPYSPATSDQYDQNCLPLSSFNIFDQDEMRKIISQLTNKSCSLDPVPTWLLKQNIDIILPVITSIVNESLSSGTFPTALKVAIVSPIIKKASLDKDNLKNYRPVSNLAFVSKVIEKAVLKCVSVHNDSFNLNCKFQSAYRSGHSTETALLRVKNDIIYALDSRRAVFLVLLDMSAAFDTVDHDVLISRLNCIFKLQYSVLGWFKSYLHGRTCVVKVANEVSDVKALSYGLPQGSCVGPQLFSFYVRSIANVISRHDGVKFHMYADDLQLYTSFDPKNPSEVSRSLSLMSNCITDVRSWMCSNMLCLNENKTEFFYCGKSCSIK